MSIIDAALTARREHAEQLAQQRQAHEDEAFDAAVEAANLRARELLGTFADELNWEHDQTDWPDNATEPIVKLRAISSEGLNFRYFSDRTPRSRQHHFQVLCKRLQPLIGDNLDRVDREYEYEEFTGWLGLGEIITEGRVVLNMADGSEITTYELAKRKAWLAEPNVTWTSSHTEEPGDQQADLYSPFWATIGPAGEGSWSWTLLYPSNADDGNDELANGECDTEAEAKAAVVAHLIDGYLYVPETSAS